jgi:hypothetical protein
MTPNIQSIIYTLALAGPYPLSYNAAHGRKANHTSPENTGLSIQRHIPKVSFDAEILHALQKQYVHLSAFGAFMPQMPASIVPAIFQRYPPLPTRTHALLTHSFSANLCTA